MERYWPSVEQLRRVLRRRVDRYCRERGGPRGPGYSMAEAVIEEFVESGALNDLRFARSWVDSLHRRGDSRPRIRGKLRQKGVSGEIIAQALEELDAAVQERGADPVLVRAAAHLRRRRLGPYRHDPERRAERRKKDLAAMARAGFPYGVALQLVDAEDTDAVELLADS